jgi:hypothetical protein
VQAAKLKGMHVANKHVKGWRADLSGTPAQTASLIQRCWSQRAEDRPSFEAVAREVEGWTRADFGESHAQAQPRRASLQQRRASLRQPAVVEK